MRKAASSKIEALLNTGKLVPGQIVSQRELVEITGVTLSAVREAVPRLEAEGLLVTLPKRGLMVPSLDVGFVRDAYHLRRLIEMGAVEAAITNLPHAQLDQWVARHEDILEQIASRPNIDVSDDVQLLDWAMHETIVGAMLNALINNVYRTTAVKIRMVVQSRLQITPYNARRVLNEHLAFLLPMREADVDAARVALGRHIDNSLTLALGGTLGDKA